MALRRLVGLVARRRAGGHHLLGVASVTVDAPEPHRGRLVHARRVGLRVTGDAARALARDLLGRLLLQDAAAAGASRGGKDEQDRERPAHA